jgi:non-lysosomal glucosylceramidase
MTKKRPLQRDIPISRRSVLASGTVAALTPLWNGASPTNAALPNALQQQDPGQPSIREASRSRWLGHIAQRYVGMPIGGIAAGTVYLGGDGTLWCWDIFNEHHEGVVPARTADPVRLGARGRRLRERDGANYLHPPVAGRGPWQVIQGSALRIHRDGESQRILPLSSAGFRSIEFAGQPPAADVTFEDDAVPLRAELHAWTPYIPLDVERSSYPAVVLDYRWTNRSRQRLRVSFDSWLENAVLRGCAARNDAPLINRVFRGDGLVGVALEADVSRQLAGLPDLRERPDFGSLAIACRATGARADADGFPFRPSGEPPQDLADSHPWSAAIASVGCDVSLGPGESASAQVVIGWHFANLELQARTWDDGKPFRLARSRRAYGSRFSDAVHVVRDVGSQIGDLARATAGFRRAWYDSTLPQWLLEQAMTAANSLQTQTVVQFEGGRFWGWEGVGCCPGTCTHVWGYAQSAARLFPQIERRHREEVDFGIALRKDGGIGMRAEFDPAVAADGQAATILRAYREHLMSPDDAFLQRLWPRVARAIDFLVAEDAADGRADGMIRGRQHNTLDADWYGCIPFCASLYVAALIAGEAMARVVGDGSRAGQYAELGARGRAQLAALFDSELGYFVQLLDPNHPDAPGHGRGCHIDQVIGQWWTRQLGLPDLYDGAQVRSALNSVWRYNHFPDVGVLRASIRNPRLHGLAFALDGEPGTVTCTWPEGVMRTDDARHWQSCYFNSCMTGFEFQVAGHMIWESDGDPSLLEKGLAVARAVFDRYSPVKRNPYNMIEASDHYARAMAAHGVFLALCGFEHDGPRRHLGFRPRQFQDARFRAAFVASEGWGSFEQSGDSVVLAVEHGIVRMRTLALRAPAGPWSRIQACSHGSAQIRAMERDAVVVFEPQVELREGDRLRLALA